MKQYFLKISGFAALVLLLHVNGFAQDESVIKGKPGKLDDRDEIIIKRKGDKDSKVVIEIKDGQVFINGKPADDYDDDNVIIRRKRNRDDDMFALAPRSPFRGGVWNY